MNRFFFSVKGFSLLLVLVVSIASAPASTIIWTNTGVGYWSVAANWSPNQVPGPGDTAIIPPAATNGATLDTTATVQNLVLNGGPFGSTGYSYDTLTVNGQLNWTNGTLGCVVTNDGVMTLAGTNGVDYQLTAFLYNNGTINLVGGNLLINFCGYNNGAFFNASNGVLNFVHDATIDVSDGQFGLCNPPFNNAGVIRKSGGTGTSPIYAPVSSSGVIDAQTGAIQFNGGGNLGGTLQSEGAGSLVFGTNIYSSNFPLTFNGNLTSTNAFLAGGNLTGNGVITGVLTWLYGAVVAGGSFTNGTQGTVILAGTNGVDYALTQEFFNAGTFKLVSGNLLIDFCGSAEGIFNNLPGGLVDFESDVQMDATCGGGFNNQGVVRKSGGSGESDIGAAFNNVGGMLDAQTGTIGLTNNYTLAGGTLNFGITGATAFGQIKLGGSATLSGRLSVDLGNGFVPANGASFPLLTYGSASGVFSPLALPPWINWETNYGPTTFTLTVSNLDGQPVLGSAVVPAPGHFYFQFAGNPTATYSILAATNLILPVSNWTVLGSASVVSNDLFQFVDTHATNFGQRFYQLRSP